MNIKERLDYIDALKFLAILSIITLHMFQMWMNGEQILHLPIYGFGEITRTGVPLFLMISGALLLNRDIEIIPFFKKKTIRIIYPFIFYTIIHIIIAYPSYLNIFSLNWYFWMIIGVYLAIPIINKFIQHSSMKEIEYYLAIFIMASAIYPVLYYLKIEHYINLGFFLAPVSYLILGYYLSRRDFSISRNKLISICIIVFCSITVIKSLGIWEIVPRILTQNFIALQSEMLSSWIDVGLLEIIQASAIFLLVKNIYECRDGTYGKIRDVLEKNTVKSFIQSVSRASYGMYLVNEIMMFFVERVNGWPKSGTEICLYIIVFSLAIFFVSWIAVVAISRIPFLKKFSGYV